MVYLELVLRVLIASDLALLGGGLAVHLSKDWFEEEGDPELLVAEVDTWPIRNWRLLILQR